MPELNETDTACDDELRDRLTELVDSQLTARIRGIERVAAGLGSRRFFRLQLSDDVGTAIARVDMPENPSLRPPGVSAEPPLEPIRAHFERSGLPVPKRLAACEGIELLEDVGTRTLEDASASERPALYERAVDLIAELQRAPVDTSVPNYARALDAGLFAYKAEQICSWLIPFASGRPTTPAEREAVASAFSVIREAAQAAPQRLAHRDFKAQNLHLLAEGDSRGRLVMIDIQGAFMAPPEYDAVCLLRDLQIALPEAEVEAQLARLRRQLPDTPTEQDFKRRFDLLTLSRVGKDLSRFLYAIQVRGDERYRAFLPNGVHSLKCAARARIDEPALGAFAEIIATLPEDACAR